MSTSQRTFGAFLAMLIATVLPCLAADPQVWQIGTDDEPHSSNEFGAHTGANEPPPGALSVVDDDFYTKGTYPAGFNGLTSQRVLSSDEPASQWERSLTPGDRTNRFHFILSSAQVAPDSRGRLTMEFFDGSVVSNSVNLGFGNHIVIVNFKTASGKTTQIASNVVTAPTKLIPTFSVPFVGAAAGPNTIEIIRTGVDIPGTSQALRFDFVKLEVDASGNTPPVPVPVPTQYANETAPFNLVLQTTDTDTPPNEIVYAPLSTPAGLSLQSTGNVIWTPTESQGGASYVVTYRVSDAGIPKMMATNSFTIVVNEVNRPPTTSSISTQTLNEGATLSVGVVASDADLPAQTLSYSIASAPAGVAVSSSGVVTWTPTEAQGPSTNTVAIRITDSGSPPLSVTNQFTVRVQEVATPPVLASVPGQTVNENTTFTYNLSASDVDLPANTLTFARVSGPTGLTVSSAGVVSWPITEEQGPSVNTVVVKVTDNGSPNQSHTNQFTITVQEVNSPPTATAVPTQIVDTSTPLSLQLAASDPDLPANTFIFERLSGPTGLTISAGGLAEWVPNAAQIPSTNTVVYRVRDSGSPSLSATNQFTVVTREGSVRYVWQVGEIEATTGTAAGDEFSAHNSNNPPPGTVWRAPTDPQFNPSTTYVADDDHYLAGIYPAGFNGLTALLSVAVDENTLDWERNITGSDRTNRLHFVLAQNQIIGSSALRLTYRIFSGWSNFNNVSYGWGVQDIVINFRNGNGLVTPLATNRITDVTTISFVFLATDVQATLGPNTLEWVSVTPQASGASIGRAFDHVLLEAALDGNPAPVPVTFSTPTIDERVPYTRTLTATDASVPTQQLTYTLISGPAGLSVASNGVLSWTPSESQGPATHAVSVRVTDSGSPPRSANHNFSITVQEVNTAPVPVAPTDLTIPEVTAWTVNSVTDDADIPANTLSYSKLSGPTALTVSSAGVVSWTPTELEGPGVYPVSIRIEDNGSPAMRATNSFVITVLEANTAPDLVAPANLTALELSPYTATLGASDPDLPANSHVFALLSGPPGLTVSPAGQVAWTPTEAQGPQNHTVSVVVTDIPGTGVTPRSTTNSFVIAVAETNAPPSFNPVADQEMDEQTPISLTLTASDPDLPANSFTFSLISGPAGLAVAPGGQVTWTPSESQGPSTNVVTVKVTDSGQPALSATNVFSIVVREANAAPTTTPLTPPPADELVAWSIQVPSEDSDQPPDVLTYSLITHPAGATINSTGLIEWTPSEGTGPGSHAFAVRIQDNGSPPRAATNAFTLVVREVNVAPTLTVPPTQMLDGINPLSVSLGAVDPDIPANVLTYELVSGPVGLTVSATGLVEWTPLPAYNDSTNLVAVKVTDDGSPPQSHAGSFLVVVARPSTRLLWEIGVDNDSGSLPFVPDGEFGVANGATDPAPGAVTRRPGDPLYNAGSNPLADDHYYFAGTYPSGYNGLPSSLQVPEDEPATAWEGRLTTADPSNRFHFLLNSAQIALNARLLLTVQLPSGGSAVGGTPTGSFSDHQVVIRFINGSGASTVVYSNLISAETTVFLDLPAPDVAATAGPNAIEIQRLGPSAANTQHWLVFDYLRLESAFEDNTPPLLEGVPDGQVDELSLFSVNLSALDGETPLANLLFSLDSGPDGVVVSPSGHLTWTPSEIQGPSTNVIIVRVSDDGLPPLKATNSFTVVVLEVNAAPTIAAPSPAPSIVEDATLGLQLVASDSDVPVNQLTFEKLSGPSELVVTPSGFVEWQTDETTGPSVNTVTVRVTDTGNPPMSATNTFNVTVLESNLPPSFAPIEGQVVEELALLSLNLSASDPDLPANAITFGLVSGPTGMNVTSGGLLTWTPSETQGPANVVVRVRATDNGSPSRSVTNEFTVQVLEVNRPPSINTIANQTVAGGGSLSVTATATDPDSPANTLAFSLVSGPAGIAVSGGGLITWTPGSAQIPSVNVVKVRVTDNGVPAASATNQFTVTVTGSAPRSVWEIGVDNEAMSDFALQSGGNQKPPGSPTVLDDDFYTAGNYPAGFNGLTSALNVASDEPYATGWERALTGTDLTNRFHLVLDSSQVVPNSMLQLTSDFSSGGKQSGTNWLEFGVHDLVIRFRNQSGVGNVLFSGRISAKSNVVVQVPLSNVSASAGANTLEFVRTGPTESGFSYYLGFDFIRVVVDGGGNQPPVFPATGPLHVNELATLNADVSASDSDTPFAQLVHALISGPAGVSVTAAGQLSWTPGETLGGTTNTVLIRATDKGIPPMSSTNTVTIVVREVNRPPTLAVVSTATVDALTPLSIELTGSDPDVPANGLLYDKISGPAALVVSPEGLVTWTPDEADLPSTNVVIVRVTDDGEPSLSATNQFTVIASSVAMEPRNSWWIGVDNSPLEVPYQPTAELGTANNLNDAPPGQVTRLPSDPQYVSPPASRDDDFYTRGIYPRGYNGLTSYLVVPNDEPFTSWESTLTHGDRTNRFHFRLRDEQADETGQLQLRFEFTSGSAISNGVTVPGFNSHDVVVRFRNLQGEGTVIYSNRISQPTQVTVNFAASDVNASAGANQIEFVRTGPLLSGHTYSLAMDYVNLESDVNALSDGDGDGLPFAWEADNHLDDGNAADAALDPDGDGLTNLQEYNGGVDSSDPHRFDTDGDGLSDAAERSLGTSPNLADTDGDGLSDAEEVNGSPASSPLLADTDGDGVRDIVERRFGTNPSSASSKPNPFRGGIGINFVSISDPTGRVGTNLPAGPVPQINWNETFALPVGNKATGSTADILTPRAGSIVRSDGTNLPNVQMTWSGDNAMTTRNSGTPDSLLMNGLIRASTTTTASVTVNNVPFSQYDVYVVVGAVFDAYRGRVRLGSSTSTDRFFRGTSTAPQADFIEILPGNTQNQPGNLVRYSNLTSSSFTVNLLSLSGYAVGIHAIQIVDTQLDADSSGIPDWWEFKYALQPGSTALASADTDGDGLSNLSEYQRGSDPRKADTDGDGITDGAETAAGALKWDTDGDGLADLDEQTAVLPSNPLVADTDGDGVNDKTENQYFSDPGYRESNSATFTGWTPLYRSASTQWEWSFENVQLVWDHGAGALSPSQDNENYLLDFTVRNANGVDFRTFRMGIRYHKGLLTPWLYSQAGGGFSDSGRPGSTLREAPIGGRINDLTSSLGFSGYGTADISDLLRFRLLAQRGTGNSWTLTYEIWNQTRNKRILQRVYSNCTAAASVDNGTAGWMSAENVVNRSSVTTPPGVGVFFTPTPLHTRPQYAAYKDTDKDGIPDVWEVANGMNPSVATDALNDRDNDGVNARDEYLLGLDPRNPDSDGDGIPDGVERSSRSNPASDISRPVYAGFVWPTGEDLNNDGLPDAWQARYSAYGVSPTADNDGDGQNNAQEALWGTNPFDPASKISLAVNVAPPDIHLNWPHQPLKRQTLFWTTNASTWVAYDADPLTDNGISEVILANRLSLNPGELYRVDTEDMDSDGDGVSDWAEGILGTDPFDPNSSRLPVRVMTATGTVLRSVFGDYATFVERLRQAPVLGVHQVTRSQAARFLRQATFGPTSAELDRVQHMGFAPWIDDQIQNQPPTLHSDYLQYVVSDLEGPRKDLTYSYLDNDSLARGANVLTSFARAATRGPDQLRQRVAFALSQILVVSRRTGDLLHRPLAIADYYDIFVKQAFGNYYDVLHEVTLHAAMGHYLSHVGNQKAIPSINQYPDENYAREVQQLFSIGLWELNPDGTWRLNALGQPIPTYSNQEITEFARVFTGLWFGGQSWGLGGSNEKDLLAPMEMWPDKHDFGSKTLLRGFVIPARTPSKRNGERDIEDALRNLFDHPNTAPFIGRQLIQFLVTSNPSTNYVSRISAVFANDGAGRRGNLAAVVKAILLDPEARDPRWSAASPHYGRLREPVERTMSVARTGRLGRHSNLLWWSFDDFAQASLQEPMLSPSVFNFFRPNYQPPGLMAAAGLVGPAFQITDSYSSISFPNKLWDIVERGFFQSSNYSFAPDYTELLAIADNSEALLDEVNLLLCGGGMSASTRQILRESLEQVAPYDRLMRVQLAVYLAATCPEGAVQR